MKPSVRTWVRPVLVISATAAMALVASAAQAIDQKPTPAAVATASPGAAATFAEPTLFPTGIRPWNIHTADVNGDHVADVVTVNGNDNNTGTVSVLLGNGDGTFAAKTDIPMKFLSFGVTIAEVTGDGKVDLVVSGGSTRGYVAVLHGGGNGAFAAVDATISVGYTPNAIVVTDVNRDRAADLVTANYFASTVSVVLGNGDGTFRPERHFMVNPTPQGLNVVDVNGDRVLDVVTGGFGLPEASASVLLGKGDGTFHNHRDFPAGESVNDVGVADFNGDGVQDVVTAEFVTRQISVLLGERGRHQPGVSFGPRTAFRTAPGPNGLVVNDLNKDGILDVLTSATPVSNRVPTGTVTEPQTEPSPEPGGVAVLHGNGDGSFQPYVLQPIQEGSITTVAAVDVNGDGWLDLVGTVMDKSQVAVWLNTTGSR